MTKILVVDDEPDLEVLVKQKFRKKIRANEYQFAFAGNGVQALEVLRDDPEIDIVLSDINMPEMDGLALLAELRENQPLIKTVIVSAYGDMQNIRTAMNRGAFDFITKPIDFNDLSITVEKTIEYVAQVKNTLQAIKENDILKMYVDESVINFMSSPQYESSVLLNEAIEGTVIFVDIVGFTRISESATPDQVVQLINTYFDIMVTKIMEHDGYIDKFIGDAVMAVYRGDFHLDRALDSAIEIRRSLSELEESETLHFKPQVSIGIRSGEMISGNIGSASLKRLDYTVIGDTVNTAARLQGAAGENQIIIGKQDYEQIKSSFECEELGTIKMKNKTEPMLIYNVVA
ncbi:MAG: response regulator [Saprospiraceae bacterium]|nr:response regulator [Saprospiraceae bacterium]